MSKSSLKRTLFLFYTLHKAFSGTAQVLEQGVRDLEDAKRYRKLEKRRARFPWPDVDTMSLDTRRELANVFYRHGHLGTARELAPGENPTLGVMGAGWVDRGQPFNCHIHGDACPNAAERRARIEGAIEAARQAMRGEPQPPARNLRPDIEIAVSFHKLQQLNQELLYRVLQIPTVRPDDDKDVLIYNLNKLYWSGLRKSDIEQLKACAPKAPPAPPPPADPSDPALRLVDLKHAKVGRHALGLAGVVQGVADEAKEVAAARRRGVAHEGPPLLGYLGGEHVAVSPVGPQRLGHPCRGVVGQDQLDMDGPVWLPVEGEVTGQGRGHPGEAAPPPIARGQRAGRQGEPGPLACKDDQARAVHAVVACAAAPSPLVERAHLVQRRQKQRGPLGAGLDARGGALLARGHDQQRGGSGAKEHRDNGEGHGSGYRKTLALGNQLADRGQGHQHRVGAKAQG